MLTLEEKKQALESLKKLHGIPPYDGPNNPVKGDGLFSKSLEKKYNCSLFELAYETGFAKIHNDWFKIRKQFINDNS